MIGRIPAIVPCLALALVLSACGPPSKEDLLAKAKGVETRTQLEKALGKADDVSKLGPIEKWTYKAKNGKVVFVLMGDTVTIEATRDEDKKN